MEATNEVVFDAYILNNLAVARDSEETGKAHFWVYL